LGAIFIYKKRPNITHNKLYFLASVCVNFLNTLMNIYFWGAVGWGWGEESSFSMDPFGVILFTKYLVTLCQNFYKFGSLLFLENDLNAP
jgi:hypothetical protein